MKIQQGRRQKYEKEKLFYLNHVDDNTRKYQQYIFNKAEEWAEKMEELINKKHAISFNEMEETFNDIDDGMSNLHQYEIQSLLRRYWEYSHRVVIYGRLKDCRLDHSLINNGKNKRRRGGGAMKDISSAKERFMNPPGMGNCSETPAWLRAYIDYLSTHPRPMHGKVVMMERIKEYIKKSEEMEEE